MTCSSDEEQNLEADWLSCLCQQPACRLGDRSCANPLTNSFLTPGEASTGSGRPFFFGDDQKPCTATEQLFSAWLFTSTSPPGLPRPAMKTYSSLTRRATKLAPGIAAGTPPTAVAASRRGGAALGAGRRSRAPDGATGEAPALGTAALAALDRSMPAPAPSPGPPRGRAFNPVNVRAVYDCLGISMTFINPAGNHAFPWGKSWSRHISGDHPMAIHVYKDRGGWNAKSQFKSEERPRAEDSHWQKAHWAWPANVVTVMDDIGDGLLRYSMTWEQVAAICRETIGRLTTCPDHPEIGESSSHEQVHMQADAICAQAEPVLRNWQDKALGQ
ncbi:hypothetical protein FQA39_LY18921 [Lamprigera yunnana]|nr:hypothetical protein FQA39_LY18921 [Lamprigera yunnana]